MMTTAIMQYLYLLSGGTAINLFHRNLPRYSANYME
jgi:hypothetical protein